MAINETNRWGQQIDLIGSFQQFIVDAPSPRAFDAIESLDLVNARFVIFGLRSEIKRLRGDYDDKGESGAVVQD